MEDESPSLAGEGGIAKRGVPGEVSGKDGGEGLLSLGVLGGSLGDAMDAIDASAVLGGERAR